MDCLSGSIDNILEGRQGRYLGHTRYSRLVATVLFPEAKVVLKQVLNVLFNNLVHLIHVQLTQRCTKSFGRQDTQSLEAWMQQVLHPGSTFSDRLSVHNTS